MKIAISLFFCLVTYQSINAQNDSSEYSIKYVFKHVRDTNNRNVFFEESMILYIGKSAALYDSYDRIIQDSVRKSKLNVTKSPSGTFVSMGQGFVPKNVTMSSLFSFSNSGKKKNFISQHYLGQQYFFEKDIATINWAITEETKQIKGLDCQKAIGRFGGRNYEAWFFNKIPLSFGPWKLSGLPGLILEAKDDKNEIIFLLEEISQDKKMAIQLPPNGIETTEKDFKVLYQQAQENPDVAMQIIMGGNTSFKPSNSSAQMRKRTEKKTINNPIELTAE